MAGRVGCSCNSVWLWGKCLPWEESVVERPAGPRGCVTFEPKFVKVNFILGGWRT